MYIRFLILFSILAIIIGCIDTIDVDLPSATSGRLVIGGVVERTPDIYRFLVEVSRTKDLQNDQIGILEGGVAISLIYNGSLSRDILNSVEDTISIENFHQLYGGTSDEARFNIQVVTDDGNIFISEEQKVLKSPSSSEILLKYDERQELNSAGNLTENGFIKLLINSDLVNADGEKVSLRWDVRGVYRFPEVAWTDDPFFYTKTCYVRDFLPLNEVNILKGSSVNGNQVREFEVTETSADFRFSSGYYFTVIQKSIDANAAEYWDQIRQSIEREGTIFDVPVGAINTNIHQIQGEPVDVLGYFYTAGIDTLRHLSSREETGNQRQLCALQLVSEACCDCLLLVNSSLNRPTYWPQ